MPPVPLSVQLAPPPPPHRLGHSASLWQVRNKCPRSGNVHSSWPLKWHRHEDHGNPIREQDAPLCCIARIQLINNHFTWDGYVCQQPGMVCYVAETSLCDSWFGVVCVPLCSHVICAILNLVPAQLGQANDNNSCVLAELMRRS